MSKAATILLVEDNRHIMDANVRVFKQAGYLVREAETLAEAREILAGGNGLPDAIVLDIKLPDGNGLDFIPEIRSFTSSPVLLLSSLSEKDERLRGLRAGGDDYISKPYDIDELVARVDAFLRREAMRGTGGVEEKSCTISCGALTIDTVSMRAYLNNTDLRLSPKEFAILHLLVINEGKALSKEYLFEKVWNHRVNHDARAVWTHISTLKKKLDEGNGAPDIISERGRGYLLRYC